ncbi:MAG: hypothetical protein ACO2PN_01925 [Pyrobaculum sp.]|jgi:hypothetical protein
MTCVKTLHKIELAQSPEEQVLDGRLDVAVHETSGWRDARGLAVDAVSDMSPWRGRRAGG